MAITCAPESLRRPGIGRFDLHRHDQRRPCDEPEVGWVFTVEVKRHGLPEIADGLIDRLSLGDDRDLDALANIPRLVAGPHDRLDRLLKLWHGYLPDASHCADADEIVAEILL